MKKKLVTSVSLGNEIFNRLKNNSPEQKNVVGPLVEYLCRIGWEIDQMVFGRKEWRVPKRPSDATKREKGRSFDGNPCDIAIFSDTKYVGDPNHLQILIECKQPDEQKGLAQLQIYMANETHAELGIWVNNASESARAIFMYRIRGKIITKRLYVHDIPTPHSRIAPGARKITFNDLIAPDNGQLKKAFEDLLDRVVARDSNVTRREEQLDQLCNIVLLKLESDNRAKTSPSDEVGFRPLASPIKTARMVRKAFERLTNVNPDIFSTKTDKELRFSDETLHECAEEIYRLKLIGTGAETVAMAFQVLRSAALKQAEGQYFTPQPVIEAAVRLVGVDWNDIVIDPCCGTGGFLIEYLLRMQRVHPKKEAQISKWAQRHLFGIDKDSIGVKLTKAVMQILDDGSAHIVRGDSVLTHTWAANHQHLLTGNYANNRFTKVFTNPPFGRGLTISVQNARKSNLDIVNHLPSGTDNVELGLAVLNRAYQLLVRGGIVCIVLPETYFFSPSYDFVTDWMRSHLEPMAVLNVPMEAFQGFCRAKTNLYVLRKVK